MKQEDKDLLLEDLCNRLSYGVKCNVGEETPYTLSGIEIDDVNGHLFDFVEKKNGLNMQVYLSEVKPYLFPMSAMTDEQKKEISKRYNYHNYYGLCIEITNHSAGYWDDDNSCNLQDYLWLENWFNKNHFDYRSLIDKGLALDATTINIY